jgi:hypothetical protein
MEVDEGLGHKVYSDSIKADFKGSLCRCRDVTGSGFLYPLVEASWIKRMSPQITQITQIKRAIEVG